MRLACLVLLAAGAAAAQNAEFTAWMKAAGAASGALDKMESKTGQPAVSAAERLGGIYENMIGFWRQRNAADAVKWSAAGKAAALELATAASAGNAESAAAAYKTLSGTCGSCHQAYREKTAGGNYRIKPQAEPVR